MNIKQYEDTPFCEYGKICDGSYAGDFIKINGTLHFRYDDANLDDLVLVDEHRVHKDAANAFLEMQKAALKDGCELQIVSGTRLKDYQIEVFKRKFLDKEHPTQEEMYSRIKWSAPSGFSEHHTGYAIDINSDEVSFKDSKEYKWLEENAATFGFENSFPENNRQNVGFEPWHWRFIGSPEAKIVFEKARQFQIS